MLLDAAFLESEGGWEGFRAVCQEFRARIVLECRSLGFRFRVYGLGFFGISYEELKSLRPIGVLVIRVGCWYIQTLSQYGATRGYCYC